MYRYSQSKAEMIDAATGEVIGEGYSGYGAGKNNPVMENIPNVGPIPCGWYTIGPSADHPGLGPLVMSLTPDPANEMFGRGDFFIHGDASDHPGGASHGCIVLPRSTRQAIAASGDNLLEVAA